MGTTYKLQRASHSKMATGGKVQVIRSSLPFQILLYLNGWYFGLFFILEIATFIYKGRTLPYPREGVLAAEIILVFILAALEAMRLFFGQKVNLTERVVAVVVSLLLALPSLFGTLYLLLWQTYVLRSEVILVSIQLTFIGLELIFSIISMVTFARAAPY